MKNNLYAFEKNMMKIMRTFLFLTVVLMLGNVSHAHVVGQAIDATQATPYTYNLTADETGIIIPISFPKIGVYTYKIEVTNFNTDIHVDFVEDLDSMDIVGGSGIKGVEREWDLVVKSPVSYYMFVFAENPSALEKTIKVTCTYNEPQTEGRAISEGEMVRSVSMDKLYYSFNLNSDCKIHIEGDKVWLCDANKETLFTVFEVSGDNTVYLKKGSYYIVSPGGIREFKYTTEKMTFAKNTAKKKAKAIKVGKKVQMQFYATQKGTTQYYKFTLKKAKKISVNADVTKLHSSGSISVSIFKKKDGTVPYIQGSSSENKGKIAFSGSVKKGRGAFFVDKKYVKLSAGTYYVAVSNTSGGDAVITIK